MVYRPRFTPGDTEAATGSLALWDWDLLQPLFSAPVETEAPKGAGLSWTLLAQPERLSGWASAFLATFAGSGLEPW